VGIVRDRARQIQQQGLEDVLHLRHMADAPMPFRPTELPAAGYVCGRDSARRIPMPDANGPARVYPAPIGPTRAE